MSDESKARLVVLEGPDGVGKSTLAAGLSDRLRRRYRCESYCFPGLIPGSLGELVYRLHHEPSLLGLKGMPHSLSLQLLHVAAHIDQLYGGLLQALKENEFVILDRFWWSTWAYGRASGIPPSVLNKLIDIELAVWGSVRPEVFLVERPGCGSDVLVAAYEELAAREGQVCRVHRITNEGCLNSTLSHVEDVLRLSEPAESPTI